MWKLALDVGLDHPQPQGLETEIRIYVPNSSISYSESAKADLEKAQRDFAEALKEDEGDAIIENASNDIPSIAAANSQLLVRQLLKSYCPTRTQKRPAHHEAQAQAIRLISRTNMANSPASATMLPSAASTSASGSLNPMAPGK